MVCLLLLPTLCFAHEDAIVDHHDRIQINPSLTLSQVIALTLEKFPDYLLTAARKQEANALQQRGDSWLAGAPNISVSYLDDSSANNTGLREMIAQIQVPLWNWGQREAGLAVAKQAHHATKKLSSAIRLDVTGLVRNALWNMNLEQLRYQQARSIQEISAKLLAKIKRRVDLGDLPRSDFLLAKSDYLQKRSLLTQAEAKMMHTRKTYISLTQSTEVPADFKETQSTLITIPKNHPKLLAINALVQRKQAELNWVKSAGSGQPSITIGGKSQRDTKNSNDIESINLQITIPFGGAAKLAPRIATANLALTQALIQQARLQRLLETQFHEAKHLLEITLTELKIANELKQIAKAHLKMIRLSFSAGEINLIDLLKIQARSNNATRLAKEREILRQKYIALYNQAVGVQP